MGEIININSFMLLDKVLEIFRVFEPVGFSRKVFFIKGVSPHPPPKALTITVALDFSFDLNRGGCLSCSLNFSDQIQSFLTSNSTVNYITLLSLYRSYFSEKKTKRFYQELPSFS